MDLAAAFGRECEVWLEIGFGSGEHLAHQASLNPEVGILGCEHYIKGVSVLLGLLRERTLSNVRMYAGDVRDAIEVLPRHSIAKVFLLYPDPWPKKRHHKRRFVTSESLDPLADAMRPGAELRLATDIRDYAEQAAEYVCFSPRFELAGAGPENWETPWEDWYPTKYERKALREGREPNYLTIRRI